jgi:DNA mismatch endonuclease (patch repair protein)
VADKVSRSTRSAIMASVPNRDTRPEKEVRACLFKAGFRFRLHVRKLPGAPDIVLARHRTVVFVQGCFWHGHDCRRAKLPATNTEYWRAKIERNVERDARNLTTLQQAGWRVFEVWTCRLQADTAFLLEALQSQHRSTDVASDVSMRKTVSNTPRGKPTSQVCSEASM